MATVTGIRRVSGVLLLAIAAAIVVFAIVNLLSLPSVERQILASVPSAEASVADAVAQSRRKSYYGIAVGTAIGLCGVVLVATKPRGQPS
jgi:hypothetical protein